jgi:hypothetical protein
LHALHALRSCNGPALCTNVTLRTLRSEKSLRTDVALHALEALRALRANVTLRSL